MDNIYNDIDDNPESWGAQNEGKLAAYTLTSQAKNYKRCPSQVLCFIVIFITAENAIYQTFQIGISDSQLLVMLSLLHPFLTMLRGTLFRETQNMIMKDRIQIIEIKRACPGHNGLMMS